MPQTKTTAQLNREIAAVLKGEGEGEGEGEAARFSSSDLNGLVSYDGVAVAARLPRGWTPVESSPPHVRRAVREAIFSLPSDVAATELRREIVARLSEG